MSCLGVYQCRKSAGLGMQHINSHEIVEDAGDRGVCGAWNVAALEQKAMCSLRGL
jgi:hypothetical protein